MNGAASDTIVLSTPNTIQGDLIANMRRGVDTLTVQGIDVSGRVTANLGNGPKDAALFSLNALRFISGSIGDDLNVRAGGGLDEVVLRAQ